MIVLDSHWSKLYTLLKMIINQYIIALSPRKCIHLIARFCLAFFLVVVACPEHAFGAESLQKSEKVNKPPTISEGTASQMPNQTAETERNIELNFDYADIKVVIETIADILDINYIMAPGVSGKVTIQTSDKVAVSDLFFILEKILEVNNLTAVKSGDFYKIIPVGTINKEALETIGIDEDLPEERMVIKIFKLQQILPSEMGRLFGTLRSPQGAFIPHDPTGILFVRDSVSRIRMFDEFITSIDVDIYENIQVEIYAVNNALAEDISRDLTQVLATVTSSSGRPSAKYKLIPVKATNSLLFVTSNPSLGRLMRKWVKELDVPATTQDEKVFVYTLNHANAENVAAILRDLYSDADANRIPREQPFTRDIESPRETSGTPQVRTSQSLPSRDGGAISSVSGKIKIVADKDTNALVIQTAAWNYPFILEIIRKLDKTPEQVLIEVTIAEITLDDTNQLGVEWALKSQGTGNLGGEKLAFESIAQAVFNTSGGPASGVPGFSYMLTEANRLTAVLNAYNSASKLNIISRPHIIASDNKEAKIDIGAEVPIITTETQSEEGTSVDKTIEYRSTGVILTVTPRINENRDVTLDVTQEVSEAQTNKLGGTDSPIIIKRTAQTSMVVKDNETLIIGGLIQTKKDRAREGIPFLSKIPILGYLFGSTTDIISKTELVVMMTPRVITNSEEAYQATEDFKNKTTILKKGSGL